MLFWNLRYKTFLDISEHSGASILDQRASRGAAFGDLDNDGGIEVVVNNINDLPSLLKNTGERQNWVLLQTGGTKSNRSGIGARVTIIADGNWLGARRVAVLALVISMKSGAIPF